MPGTVLSALYMLTLLLYYEVIDKAFSTMLGTLNKH